ncbi:MAG TPA: CPBP family intramembrane glutamic endopeptidase [Mycobacteriales bacterium]|nr:CPBP family intramembrane glutamic endopeptidase [Mycobacteriales bacterium]
MRAVALLAGLAVAVGMRVVVGDHDVARSIPAGLVFAACLLVLSLAARTRVPVTRRAVVLGLVGVVVVCLPVGLGHLLALRPLHATDGFLPWALAVIVVAGAEEVFLRGTLFEALRTPWVAVLVSAVAFALLHVPLYGWQAVPLDLAVGVVLGGLRLEAGTAAAPAVTHIGADLVGWFLR